METVDGPIRSRFRGLYWDKKHQGWRVRIYYAGKQRHVGRFEDDISAAKAYDKAAVYLYGANAITNFGLEAVQADPAEVSGFIILAKEQVDLEQQTRSQQRHFAEPYKTPPSAPVVQAALHYDGLHSGKVLQVNSYTDQALQRQQGVVSLAGWQQQAAGVVPAGGVPQSLQQLQMPQMQQAWNQQLPGHTGQVLLMMPATMVDSSVSCMTSVASGSTNSGTTISNGTTISSGNSSSHMLCSSPAVHAASPLPGQSYTDSAALMLQQLQPKQQCQQLLFFSNSSQPLQLSVQPQMTTISDHMAAAAAANPVQQQQLLQQQLSDMIIPMSFPYSTANADCGNFQTLAAVDSQLAAAAASGNLAVSSMGTVVTACANPNPACVPMSMNVNNMLCNMQGLPAYSASAASAVTGQHAGFSTINQQQQNALLISGSCAAECASSSCSPLLTAARMQGTANAVQPALLACQANKSLNLITPTGTCMQLASSPTYSSSSSGVSSSRNYGMYAALV